MSEQDNAMEATPEDIAEIERRYGKTIEELVEEAERGYDVTKIRPRDRDLPSS